MTDEQIKRNIRLAVQNFWGFICPELKYIGALFERASAQSSQQGAVAWARKDVPERLASPTAYSVGTELLKNPKEGYIPLYTHPAITQATDSDLRRDALDDAAIGRAVEKWFECHHEHIEDVEQRFLLRMRDAIDAALSQQQDKP